MELADRYKQIKRQIETAQQEADRAAGALQQIEERLKSEYNCNSIAEAEKKIKTLTKKQETVEAEFEKALEAFEEKWPDES